MLPIITVISFLGIKAIPEAIKAARAAYASHPGAAADILRLLEQENIQQAAQAMQELLMLVKLLMKRQDIFVIKTFKFKIFVTITYW